MKRDTRNDSMYSGTPCNKCGGPTLLLNRGSIWCPAEGPHAGGHFVKRVAFERTPAQQAAFDARQPRRSAVEIAKGKGATYLSPAPKTVAKPTLGGGYDDFVESDHA